MSVSVPLYWYTAVEHAGHLEHCVTFSVCDHDSKLTDPAVPVSLLCHRGGGSRNEGDPV